jgi:hypothetical protein
VDFYATAAQVLPVIVLVLVVEFRLFGGTERPGGWWASAHDLKPGERVSSWTALFVVVWLNLFFLAEILSLGALHRGSASGFTKWVVWTALVLGFQQIIFVPTQPYVETLLDRSPAYRLKVWVWRRTGTLARGEPDPPKAGEEPPAPPAGASEADM